MKRNDPSAHGWLEVVLCHAPLHAGRGLFIDHGAGVVVGGTVVVGEYCVLFHNVTLGGTGRYHG